MLLPNSDFLGKEEPVSTWDFGTIQVFLERVMARHVFANSSLMIKRQEYQLLMFSHAYQCLLLGWSV